MNNRKILIALTLAACMLLGGLTLLNNKWLFERFQDLARPELGLQSTDLSNDELISRLSLKTMMILRIDLRRFDAITNSTNHFFETLNSTRIGRINNTSELIAMIGNNLFNTFFKSLEGDQHYLSSVRETSLNIFKTLNVIDLVITKGGDLEIEGISIPEILISASFVDSTAIDQLFKFIDQKLPVGSEPLTNKDATFTRVTPHEVKYLIESDGKKLHGQLTGQNNTLKFIFANDREENFYKSSKEDALYESDNFQSIKIGALQNQAAFF